MVNGPLAYNSGGSRGGAQGACPPLFLDQTEAQRAGKKFFGDQPSPPLSRRLVNASPPPPPRASKAFACLVVFVAGKFYGISSLNIFD